MSELLHTVLQSSARNYLDQIAFKCSSKTLTYNQLDLKSDELAVSLINEGLNKGERVVVFMNRCIESVIAVYGILKAGGVIVPIDVDLPIARYIKILNTVDAAYLCTTRVQLRKVAAFKDTINLSIIELAHTDDASKKKKSNQFPKIVPEDLAYIIYTSGSTGEPKGICHTHRSALSYCRLSKTLYNITSDDVIINHSPLHYDISTFGYYTSVYSGATTILLSDAHVKMPASMVKLLENEKITIWYSVPIALIQMLKTGLLEHIKTPVLRWILYGGEVFPSLYIRKIAAVFPDAKWSNVYGPAEVNQCSYYNFSGKLIPEEVPLGIIWDESEGIILDSAGNECSQGEVGELLVASITMMKEYWRSPEKTRKSLYSKGDKVFYKTGDLVERKGDGLLYFCGRKDRQIKIKGQRVELKEIEMRLSELIPESNLVVYFGTREHQKYLIAYIERVNGHIPEESSLREALKKTLPSHCVPEEFKFVQSLPRTAAGKVDYLILSKSI